MADKQKELIQAVDFALSGKWDDAHKMVQRYDGDETANWIHAALHRIEGDETNAKYWYRRAGQGDWVHSDPEDQLRAIRDKLTNRA